MNSLWRWCQVTGMRSERKILLFATIYAVNNGISFTMNFCVLLAQLNLSKGIILRRVAKIKLRRGKSLRANYVNCTERLHSKADCIVQHFFYYICGSSHYITNILLVRDYSLVPVLLPHVIFKLSIRQNYANITEFSSPTIISFLNFKSSARNALADGTSDISQRKALKLLKSR